MDTIILNSENGTTSVPHRLLLYHSNKINIKRNDKYVALSNLSIYYTWKNVKMSCENNKFKVSAPAWNEVSVTWWVLFCIRYSSLSWLFYQKTLISEW